MTWDKGFDFRDSSGYVTDPANCTYVLMDTYPTTRNSVTFGWTAATIGAVNTRDRDATYPRIAGIHFTNTSLMNFQIDLPAPGNYAISLGLGDWASSKFVGKFTLKDDTTTLLTIDHSSATNGLYDATDTDLTGANWNTSQTPVVYTFATSTLKFALETGGHTLGSIAHLFISQQAGGGGSVLGSYYYRLVAGMES